MTLLRAVRIAAALLSLGLLAACAGPATSDSAGSTTTGTTTSGALTSEAVTSRVAASVTTEAAGTVALSAPAPAVEPAAVPAELQFTATTLDGAEFTGASLAGKPAVLWFWAPWCPTCRAEAPQVAAAAAATAGEVTFVGVAARDDLPAMQSFVDNYGVGGFEHLADLDASIWQRFGVTYQPAYAFIGADGSVEVVKSRVSEDELASRLDLLIAP